jgi:hypothetical protein
MIDAVIIGMLCPIACLIVVLILATRRYADAIEASERQIEEVKLGMITLAQHTNSMKDALVLVASQKAYLEGLIAGRGEGAVASASAGVIEDEKT